MQNQEKKKGKRKQNTLRRENKNTALNILVGQTISFEDMSYFRRTLCLITAFKKYQYSSNGGYYSAISNKKRKACVVFQTSVYQQNRCCPISPISSPEQQNSPFQMQQRRNTSAGKNTGLIDRQDSHHDICMYSPLYSRYKLGFIK